MEKAIRFLQERGVQQNVNSTIQFTILELAELLKQYELEIIKESIHNLKS